MFRFSTRLSMEWLSKIKVFSFSEKIRKRSPMGLDVGTIFEPKLTTIDEKRGSQNCFKKGYPPKTQTALYSQAGRLLETGTRVRVFEQKQQFGQQQQRLQQQLQKRLHNLSNNSSDSCTSCGFMLIFVVKLVLFWLIFLKEKCCSLQNPKACDLTRPGQGPANLTRSHDCMI